MARANRIASHLFQYLHLTLQRASVDRHAERPEVGVIAHAIDLQVATIEKKSGLGVKLDGPNTEGGFILVHRAPILRERCHRNIAVRVVHIQSFGLVMVKARSLTCRVCAGIVKEAPGAVWAITTSPRVSSALSS